MIIWTSTAEAAFLELKEAVVNAPMLHTLQPDLSASSLAALIWHHQQIFELALQNVMAKSLCIQMPQTMHWEGISLKRLVGRKARFHL